jgi:predicted GNAT family acetyltransferase
MAHPLDRPVWTALATGWAQLAEGDDHARRLDRDYGVFGAAADRSAVSQTALGLLVPEHSELWLIEPEAWPPPPGTRCAHAAAIVQLVAEKITPGPAPGFGFGELNADDASAMHDLATLTRPGPYVAHTNRLGRFIGVKSGSRLVAMAGERMAMPGMREVSGVCTHPDFRGRGYAGGLMRVVAELMLARGEMPFLHAYAGNTSAIALYQQLGFQHRADLIASIFVRA